MPPHAPHPPEPDPDLLRTLVQGDPSPSEPGFGQQPPEPPGLKDPNTFPYATWGPVAALAAATPFLLLALASIGTDSGDEEEISTGFAIGAQLVQAFLFISIPAIIALATGVGNRLISAVRAIGLCGFRFLNGLKWVGLGGLSYIGCAVLIVVTMTALGLGAVEQDDLSSQFGPLWVQFLMIAVLAPISEEIFFRGLVFGGLRRAMGPITAALASGLIFGLLHAPTGITAVLPLVAFGVILAVVYERTGSLWPPIALHALNNSIALIALNSS